MCQRPVPVVLAALAALGLLCPSPAARAQNGAQAQQCTTMCPPPALPPNAKGMPLKLSESKRYFDSYTTSTTIPLLGQSYEYTCHICQPTQNSNLCTLTSYPTVFGAVQPANNNLNTVLRLETIFNSSPGAALCSFPHVAGKPFASEEIFRYTAQGWDLSKRDTSYLRNLDRVVGAANASNIIVEVTLFDPWDKSWNNSPFNPANTVAATATSPKLGFTDRSFFMTLYNCSVGDTADSCQNNPASAPHPNVTDYQQNVATRAAQVGALCSIVRRLAKYPNVIFEVANEPDLVQTAILPADVFKWEQSMVGQIRACDAHHHLVQINGHHQEKDDHTSTTFAWQPNCASCPGCTSCPPSADLASAHYAYLNPDPASYLPYWRPNLFGALDLLQSTDPAIAGNVGNQPLAFNEDLGDPDLQHPQTDPNRTDAEVRSEALEFITSGGGLFDGYSEMYGSATRTVNNELQNFAKALIPGGSGVTWFDGMKPASCCQGTGCSISATGPWCWGLPAPGSVDHGTCPGTPADIYWSTIANPGPYQSQIASDALLYVHHGLQQFFSKTQKPGWEGGYTASFCPSRTAPVGTGGYGLSGLAYTAPAQQAGCYSEIWIDPASGMMLHQASVSLSAGAAPKSIAYQPAFAQDVLLFLKYLSGPAPCGTASMTSAFTASCSNLSCSFDGSGSSPAPIASYAWSWGDETSSSMTTPSAVHSFTAPGHYVVSLTVADASGDTSAAGQQLTVASQPPTPSFTASCNQLSCTFDGTGSTAGDAPIVDYSWSFDDDSFAAAATVTGNTYAAGGLYDVTLTVTDSFGVMASTTQTLTVIGPPAANFTVACDGLTCAFDASGTTGDSGITAYSWAFGDGGSGAGPNPTYAYAGSGTYTVKLTVTDANGQTGSATAPVNVFGPPSATFALSCSQMTCTVHPTASGALPLTTWTWDFGDGTVVTPTSPYPWADQTHTYAQPGRYTITLTVTDTAGQTGSLALAVLANIAPTAANVTASTPRDVPVTIDVLVNAADPDGDVLMPGNVNLSAYPGASWQGVQLANGRWALKVTPPDAFVGTMTFTYQVCDNWGACSSPATVTLTVTPVIVEPLGDQFYCPQNQSIQIPRATLLANDYDSKGDPLTIVSFDTSILMGTLDCTTNAAYCTYTPPTNGAGYTLFRYTVSDPAGTTASAPVRIYVGYPDQAPTASEVFLTTTAGTPKTFTYNDIAFQKAADPDGDTVTIGLQSQQTAYGSLTCSTPFYTCTYTPNPGYVGTDRFLYTATDMIHPPVTAGFDVLTLPLTTPTFDAREDVVVTWQNQRVYISSGSILGNDYLPNGGPEVVTSLDTSTLNGSLSCDSYGCEYTPPSFYAGITTFKYNANDSHGGTDTAIVRICVGCTNHPPVAAPQTLATPRNTALRFSVFQLMQNSYDPDDDPLTVTIYTGTFQLGTLSCSNPQYWCTYTPNANATGADAISYALSDGQTSVTSTLTINVQ